MKFIPQMEAIQAAMQPGQITHDGFLGNDSRSLAEILAHDQATVDRLGLSHRAIAQRMLEFRDAGREACGDWIAFSSRWDVRVDSARGKLPCPFGEPGLHSKTSITVRDRQDGQEITFTDLHIHLIGHHGFYEGKGSVFRLEPDRLAKLLDRARAPEPCRPA